MSMKEIHATETRGITGTTRSHIISRLRKAAVYANDLVLLLRDQSTTGATDKDVLEARAYAASLNGAMHFEKQSWEVCVKSYSEARIIYSALDSTTKTDIFKDLLSDPVDVSIRYGAYQMRIPRTRPIPAISREYFPTSDSELVRQVEKMDPDALNARPTKARSAVADGESVPKSITWRSRTVELEDAAIATALGLVQNAIKQLSEKLSSTGRAHAKDMAAAYDDVLILSQDAVDATKQAIDELISERVGSGDKRMQSLQITRTAVSYDMISWRIGRNRVLAGDMDGAAIESFVGDHKKNKKHKLDEEPATGRKLAHLREKVVLYDAILQSLDSIRELPGVAADSNFVEEINAKNEYFTSLK
jgi:signal recognition particle subunit SRP68